MWSFSINTFYNFLSRYKLKKFHMSFSKYFFSHVLGSRFYWITTCLNIYIMPRIFALERKTEMLYNGNAAKYHNTD